MAALSSTIYGPQEVQDVGTSLLDFVKHIVENLQQKSI